MSPQATNPGRSIGVIEAKIALPRVQPAMLRRSRLLEIVDGYGGAALTVVNAPVGYGNTRYSREPPRKTPSRTHASRLALAS